MSEYLHRVHSEVFMILNLFLPWQPAYYYYYYYYYMPQRIATSDYSHHINVLTYLFTYLVSTRHSKIPILATKWLSLTDLVPHSQLRHFYLTVIRPVLEYASPVWHHLITKKQSDQIEAIQKRAIRIIYRCAHDMPYASAIADLPTMSDRRDQLARKLFKSTIHPTSSLRNLLSPPQNFLASPPELLCVSICNVSACYTSH